MGKAKYVYVIEWEDDGETKRVHHHVIMSGMDRETAETIWGAGRTNAARLQPDDAGLEALARYITKGTGHAKHSKRWGASKGLKKPKITTADKKISKRQMARMAAGGGGRNPCRYRHSIQMVMDGAAAFCTRARAAG